ncbi:MAG: HD domain-containing protein [Deltaproteobacteria bacterium]|nr:HD domain-containing protein [Deltaproteobacteria bacterium]
MRWELVIILGVLILAFAAAKLVRKSGESSREPPAATGIPEPPADGQQIELGDLSQVWNQPEEERVISLAELSRNWLAHPDAPAKVPEPPPPAFRHPEIAAFHRELVEGKGNMVENVRLCIDELLRILDQEGDCPSVVNRNTSEAEGKLEKNVFARLAELPLYRHSLNVAREIASHCSQQITVPKAVITGLSHDLGKLPSYQEAMYCTGDHPLIAPTVLEKIDSFRKLTYADEVTDAVRQHHRAQPESDLGKKLKSADQTCRNKEIAALLGPGKTKRQVEQRPEHDHATIENDPDSSGEVKMTESIQESRTSPKETDGEVAAQETQAANATVFGAYEDQDSDIFGATGDEQRIVNSLVPIEWFDPAAALSYLKQFINRMKGGRFYAFSMPDGTVYIQVAFFWMAAKRLSSNDSKLLTADADIQARRDIMFSMVERLKESKAIATDLLGPGFFMARFVINPESEAPREDNFIPFRAEAFGEPVSILEARKVHRLREIRRVTAKHLLEKQGSPLG